MVNRAVDPRNPSGTSHPIHLHGHYFYVTDVVYPSYNQLGRYVSATDKVECITSSGSQCPRYFITSRNNQGILSQDVRWRNDVAPTPEGKFAIKDTVIVPYGGYTTIRFVADNPGWWFFHCHIEVHQLEGMAAIIKELIF